MSSRPGWQKQWTPISTQNTKISQVWWWVPVIPATQDAEARESLEFSKQMLQWAEITALHSSPGNKSKTPSQKNWKIIIAWNQPWVSIYTMKIGKCSLGLFPLPSESQSDQCSVGRVLQMTLVWTLNSTGGNSNFPPWFLVGIRVQF